MYQIAVASEKIGSVFGALAEDPFLITWVKLVRVDRRAILEIRVANVVVKEDHFTIDAKIF